MLPRVVREIGVALGSVPESPLPVNAPHWALSGALASTPNLPDQSREHPPEHPDLESTLGSTSQSTFTDSHFSTPVTGGRDCKTSHSGLATSHEAHCNRSSRSEMMRLAALCPRSWNSSYGGTSSLRKPMIQAAAGSVSASSAPATCATKSLCHLPLRYFWDQFGESLGWVRLPRTSPQVPWTSPKVPQRLPRKLFVWSFSGYPEAPRKFPRLPRKFPGLPRRSGPFSGKPPSPGSQNFLWILLKSWLPGTMSNILDSP